jgi:NodT family efflux transporter outer membrane factor (OMF) lipoprotein
MGPAQRILGPCCGALLALLTGCALGPDFKAPEAPVADHYNHGGDPAATTDADGQAQHFEAGVGSTARWWQLFHSATLDTLVDQGLAQNPGVAAAQASLRQSQSALQAGYGVFYPQVYADAGAAREKFSPALFGGTTPGPTFNLFTLSASVSYALDVFGGQRRAVEGLAAQVDLQQALLLGNYLALSGNIVNTAIARAAYEAEAVDTRALIDMQRTQVSLAEKQFDAGTVAYGTVFALRNQLAQFEASLPPLQQKADQAAHLLATLGGRLPSEWQPPAVTLSELALPSHLPLSLPSELVRRRPDIVAAEAALHSASASIGVATAALFPTFTLNGGFGQYGTSTSTLFASNGNFWNLGVDLAAPIFDGGILRARKQAAVDAYQQSLALYRQTVLGAFGQVADTIRALQHDAEALRSATDALAAAEGSWHLLEANERAGLANGLAVLAAEVQYRQARIGYVQAQALRLQDTTALFIALGGGWENPTKTGN